MISSPLRPARLSSTCSLHSLAKPAGTTSACLRRKGAGFSLIELLVVIAVITILAGIAIPTVIKAFHHCRAWAAGCYDFHNNRIEAFCIENDVAQQFYATSSPTKMTFFIGGKER